MPRSTDNGAPAPPHSPRLNSPAAFSQMQRAASQPPKRSPHPASRLALPGCLEAASSCRLRAAPGPRLCPAAPPPLRLPFCSPRGKRARPAGAPACRMRTQGVLPRVAREDFPERCLHGQGRSHGVLAQVNLAAGVDECGKLHAAIHQHAGGLLDAPAILSRSLVGQVVHPRQIPQRGPRRILLIAQLFQIAATPEDR